MGWNFRKRAKLFPGVYINFSNRGISTTIGPRGANFNISSRGTYFNSSIPGLGLYNREKISGGPGSPVKIDFPPPVIHNPVEIGGEIKSAETEVLTSNSFEPFKKLIVEAHEEKKDIEVSISKLKGVIGWIVFLKYLSWILIFGFFIKWIKNKETDKREEQASFQKALEVCKVKIELEINDEGKRLFENAYETYKALMQCQSSWDVTHEFAVDSVAQRTAATRSVNRKRISIFEKSVYIIDSIFNPIHLPDANGLSIFVYPGFVVVLDRSNNIGLIDMRDLSLNFLKVNFHETEGVPSDSKVIGQTWFKANKNGSRDKRFASNYQIPIVEYGQINFKSTSGLNEEFKFSNADVAQKFVHAVETFKNRLSEISLGEKKDNTGQKNSERQSST